LRLLAPVGLLIGFGLATKWSAGLWLIGLLIWESIERLRARQYWQLPWILFCLLILPVGIYLLSFLPMFLQGKSLSYFLSLHSQIWRFQLQGAGTHLYQSTPWQWLLNLRPVWYWSGGQNQQIYALNNPLLAWFSVGSLVLLLAGAIKTVKSQTNYALYLLIMLAGVLLLPWLFSPRIAFYYHYTPVTPVMAILLAFVLHTLYLRRPTFLSKFIFWLILTSLVWSFWLYYPLWVGLPVTEGFGQTVYWLLPTWR
jgi:dolichyl-phosphate-mannose--protein O-mannosyl transferase